MLAAVYGPHDMRESRLRPNSEKVTVNCQYSMAVFRWAWCIWRMVHMVHLICVVHKVHMVQGTSTLPSTGERKRRPRGDRKSMEMSQVGLGDSAFF